VIREQPPNNRLYMVKLHIVELSSIEDQRHSDRPRYRAHTCWAPPLPLLSAAPRRTPRRASAQLMTCTNTLYGRPLMLNPNDNPGYFPWLSMPCELGFDHPYTLKNSTSKVGQFRREKVWKQTDGRTDRRTLQIALVPRLTWSVQPAYVLVAESAMSITC